MAYTLSSHDSHEPWPTDGMDKLCVGFGVGEGLTELGVVGTGDMVVLVDVVDVEEEVEVEVGVGL